jgi:hypothetical protein
VCRRVARPVASVQVYVTDSRDFPDVIGMVSNLVQRCARTEIAGGIIRLGLTPPLPASRVRASSGTFRGWSSRAWAQEWEKITGARATSSAARAVSAEVRDRSTSMPIRCISRTTSWPKGDRPPLTGVTDAESAQEMLVAALRPSLASHICVSTYRAASTARRGQPSARRACLQCVADVNLSPFASMAAVTAPSEAMPTGY